MSKQLLLITGASGHLGFRTLVLALEGGYRARVTLRELEQVAIIEQAPILAPYLDSIEYVMVPDITAPDAYTRAIENVDGVLHIASPIPHALPRDNVSHASTSPKCLTLSAKIVLDVMEETVLRSGGAKRFGYPQRCSY